MNTTPTLEAGNTEELEARAYELAARLGISTPTPETDYAFDGDLSVGVLPQITTWQQAKDYACKLERDNVQLRKERDEANRASDNHFKIKQAAVVENVQLKKDLKEQLAKTDAVKIAVRATGKWKE